MEKSVLNVFGLGFQDSISEGLPIGKLRVASLSHAYHHLNTAWRARGLEMPRADRMFAAYVSAEDAEALVQVGLAADIAPITNMMVKLALVELSKGTNAGIAALEGELPFNYYLWANRRERRHRNWSPFPTAGNRPRILRWYGAMIEKNAACSVCGKMQVTLDEGEDVEAQLEALNGAP